MQASISNICPACPALLLLQFWFINCSGGRGSLAGPWPGLACWGHKVEVAALMTLIVTL